MTFLAAAPLGASRPLEAAQPAQLRDVASVPARVARDFYAALDREMIDWLRVPPTARVLDAGCGRGDHLLQFARVANTGQVTGLDIADNALATARTELEAAGVSPPHVELGRGDINRLPFDSGRFDLAWSSHVLHFQPDPVAALRELARVTRPGGRVVVRENFSLRVMLPRDTGLGRPGLESRLTATFNEWFESDRLARGRLPMGWRGAMARAGMADTRVQSFLHEVAAPFTADQRAYLHTLLAGRDDPRLEPDDRRVLGQLLDTVGPHYFLNRLDVHFVAVSTLYVAAVPGPRPLPRAARALRTKAPSIVV
jgi:SAM-dependent methyltransferase